MRYKSASTFVRTLVAFAARKGKSYDAHEFAVAGESMHDNAPKAAAGMAYSGTRFDRMCADMRLKFIEQMKGAGWSDDEARAALPSTA
jgi:hypothetical protein